MRKNTLATSLVFSSLMTVASFANAVDLLTTAKTTFYEPGHNIRTGIEIEFTGLSVKRVIDVVHGVTGGLIRPKTEIVKTTLKGEDANGNAVYNTAKLTEYEITSPAFGKILIKPDMNQKSDFDAVVSVDNAVVEIVTSPLHEAEALKFQEIATALQKAGAIGTTDKNPVSIQMNNEQNNGDVATMDWTSVLNLIRSEYLPAHVKMINTALNVPAIRQPYILPMTNKTVEKLLNPKYQATARNLYDDIIYRQSLELLKVPNAWKMPMEQARRTLLSQKNPIVPRVVKQTKLRVSSLLMAAFPNDPMTKLYQDSGWARALPLIEWRQNNNDFDVVSAYKESIGLMQAAKRYGYYDHDTLMSKLSGIDQKSIKDLRKKSLESASTGDPYMFRYYLGNADKVDRSEYSQMTKAYDDTIVGFLPFTALGAKALTLPGESTVFHRIPLHRYSVMGKYNPSLTNFNISQVLENKYTEAKFWDEYAPNSMPQTELLSHLMGGQASPEDVMAKLNERFPKGWVLKGVWDLGTENFLVTSKMNLAALVGQYRASTFDAFKSKIEAQATKTNAAPEYVLGQLKEHPNYMGWKIAELLSNSHLTIAQNAVNITREFRVEVIAGKVLGKGSTQDRYYYKYKYSSDGREMKDYVVPDAAVFTAVEAYAQSILDKLPPELHDMTFGMDIAWLDDGSFTMIESNPGGNSNFLFEEEDPSVRALRQVLDQYPARVKSGEVNLGLSGAEQMKYLSDHFAAWGVDPVTMYPGMKFEADHITDQSYTFQNANANSSNYSKMKCSAVFLR